MTKSGEPRPGWIGKYQLVRMVATGGMAELFLARVEWGRGVERLVAIKRILQLLAENPTFIEMFLSEAQLASRLNHPNIVQIIEFGESEGVFFLAMEYVDGPSLRALGTAAWERGTGLPFAHCARIGTFICEALIHAHELAEPGTGRPLQLIHRDISPDNILIARSGAVKVVDFGIAKAVTQLHRTKTGLVKGKLSYMAPEQLRAEVLDLRADVYALGVVLYELVSGKKPYDSTSEVNLIHAVLYEDMVPLCERRPDVPEELVRIIARATERDREQRYPDCRAMHADLEQFLRSHGEAVSALQLAELVKAHDLAASPTGSAPPPRPLVTPLSPRAQARTPMPWSAARTPSRPREAAVPVALAATGTDGPIVPGPESRPEPRPVPVLERGSGEETVRIRPLNDGCPVTPEPSPPAPPPGPVVPVEPEGLRPSPPARSHAWSKRAMAAAGALLIGASFALVRTRTGPAGAVDPAPPLGFTPDAGAGARAGESRFQEPLVKLSPGPGQGATPRSSRGQKPSPPAAAR